MLLVKNSLVMYNIEVSKFQGSSHKNHPKRSNERTKRNLNLWLFILHNTWAAKKQIKNLNFFDN